MSPEHENFQTTAPPGTIIELAEITQIPAFEDMVAHEIDCKMTPRQRAAWIGRVPLRDIIRPARFNSTISDIRLEVMAEPYERLLDAATRSVKLGRGGNFSGRSGINSDQKFRYQGFFFSARARSSGRGEAGEITAELWYMPASLMKSGESISKQTAKYGGRSVHRVESRPQLIEARFEVIRADSRRIALEELRRQLRSPIITPMRS